MSYYRIIITWILTVRESGKKAGDMWFEREAPLLFNQSFLNNIKNTSNNTIILDMRAGEYPHNVILVTMFSRINMTEVPALPPRHS